MALTLEDAKRRLSREVGAMRKCRDVIISSDVPLRLDGEPRSGARPPSDPGVCVYLTLDGEPYAFPCDRWKTVADNLAAVAAHLGALRGIERWGVADLRTAFAGHRALPSPDQVGSRGWREVLGVSDPKQADAAYRSLASLHHPDRGGDPAVMATLNRARDEARRELAS